MAMEACSGAHGRARRLRALGLDARLVVQRAFAHGREIDEHNVLSKMH